MSRNYDFDLRELLDWINPSACDYTEWLEVGMALKEEGYSVDDWDTWSRRDLPRYNYGECQSKWESFQDEGITGATITAMAKENGWKPKRSASTGSALDWDSTISDEIQIVDQSWVEDVEIQEPSKWSPKEQVITYLNTLFDDDDYVGYVTKTYETEDGKHFPTKGVYTRTAGELVAELNKYGDDIGATLGDYNPKAGAWIRFNPLDGEGVKNNNVRDFRYALVESDSMDIARQNAILRELELPIAVLVYSGGKSLHAIVKIDANSLPQYRERVDYLYNVCIQNGLEVDRQNKNPSRLSRLPGVTRGEHKQFIVDTNIGKSDWNEWEEWIEDINDDLPDPESLADVWLDMPEKSPELIEGVLRQGHKMLLAGPSKAGKSFALIQLSIAIAEGGRWFGWKCTQGKVLYVNLELDEPSAYHRFKDVYEALGLPPNNLHNIDVWNLRGKTVPMDKLAPKLIRRAEKSNYMAVIIDPIYKVLTGDENSAQDMAHFTNQFDKIASQLGCAVVYCHHHSKGAQGGKASMDRSSGSGVFARDPDAILDMIELNVTEAIRYQITTEEQCKLYRSYLDIHKPGYRNRWISQDDQYNLQTLSKHARKVLPKDVMQELDAKALNLTEGIRKMPAFRIESTLREFAEPGARDFWFSYPIHIYDDSGLLKSASPDFNKPFWNKGVERNKETVEDRKQERRKQERTDALDEAFSVNEIDGVADVDDVAEALGKSVRTIRRYVEESGIYTIVDSQIVKETE